MNMADFLAPAGASISLYRDLGAPSGNIKQRGCAWLFERAISIHDAQKAEDRAVFR
jgi:hypothetical protein